MNPHRNEAGDKAGFQIEKLDGVRDVTVNQITNASSVRRIWQITFQSCSGSFPGFVADGSLLTKQTTPGGFKRVRFPLLFFSLNRAQLTGNISG